MNAETGLDRPHVFLPADDPAAGPPLLLLRHWWQRVRPAAAARSSVARCGGALGTRDGAGERHAAVLPSGQRGVFDEEDLRRRADELAEFVVAASAAYGIEDRSLVAVGFSNGANIASALLLQRPGLLAGAVLLAAMVPYAEPPAVDLSGTLVIISNGDRDPMIAAELTQQLASQLRERGAEVVELPHPGGHQIYPAVLPEIRRIIADATMPTTRSAE